MHSMQHRCGSAVCTHYQPGVFVLLVHLGRAPPVLSHLLDDIPNLLRDPRWMVPLEHTAFLLRIFDMAFALIGLCAVLHVDGTAQV